MDTRDTQMTSREEQIRSSWNKQRAEQGLPPLPPGTRPGWLTWEDYEEDARMASAALQRAVRDLQAQKDGEEPNWTELLEREYKNDPSYWRLVEHFRSQGRTDKEIFSVLESFG